MTRNTEDPGDAVSPPLPDEATRGVTKQKRLNRSRNARLAATAASEEAATYSVTVPPASAPPGAPSEFDKANPDTSGSIPHRPDPGLHSQPREPISTSEKDVRRVRQTSDEGDSDDVSTVAENDRGSGKARVAGRPRPTNLAEFVEAAYFTTSKFGLSAADFEILERSLAMDGSLTVERDRILELASKDQTLRGLVNLLSPISQHAPRKSPLRERISDLAIAALWHHPLFNNLTARPRTPAGLPDVSAKRIWQAAPEVAKGLGQSESQGRALRANAVTAFSLLRVIRADWTLEELVVALGGTLWASVPDSSSRSAVAAAILVGAGDHDLRVRLGVLYEWAAHATHEAEKQSSAASAASTINLRRASEAEARVAALELEVAELERDLSERGERLRLSEAQLRNEKERSSVARSHHADDYEVLRTQIVRQLSKQTDLLADGLHALRNGSHGIAEEFVDRALTAITREVANLKDDGENK